MNYEQFLEQMKEDLQARFAEDLPPEYADVRIGIRDVEKLQGESYKDNSAAGTTEKPVESDAANPIEDIAGTKQPEGTIDRSVTITDDTGSEITIPVSNVEMLLTLMEKLQGKGDGKQTGTVTTNGDVLNVRTGSSTDYDIIDQLRNGSIVEVLGEENGWYKIRIPDSTGFVCGDYLSVSTAQEELISRDDLKMEQLTAQVAERLSPNPDRTRARAAGMEK